MRNQSKHTERRRYPGESWSQQHGVTGGSRGEKSRAAAADTAAALELRVERAHRPEGSGKGLHAQRSTPEARAPSRAQLQQFFINNQWKSSFWYWRPDVGGI